MYFKCIYCIS